MSKRVMKVGAEGWPAGRIIDDKSKYGPQGVEALDQIDPKNFIAQRAAPVEPVQEKDKVGEILAAAAAAKNVEESRWTIFRNIAILIVLIVFVIVVEVLRLKKAAEREKESTAASAKESSMVVSL